MEQLWGLAWRPHTWLSVPSDQAGIAAAPNTLVLAALSYSTQQALGWGSIHHPITLTPSHSPPDPLSPTNVTLSGAEEQSSLQAHWSTPAGQRDFYLVTLREAEDGAPTRNISVGGDNSRVTFHGLSPGKQYSVQVTAVSGPYRASARSAAAWTRKQKAEACLVGPFGCPAEGLSSCKEGCGSRDGAV